MTTFGDQVYQYGGVPVNASGIPLTYGDVYFVDYNSGSDDGNGKKINDE